LICLMSDLRRIFYSFVLLVMGIFFFISGYKSFRRKRLIEDTPTSKIRAIAMGLVEIYGMVVPYKGKILKSPLTNKDCVYYFFIIEEYRSSEKGGRWVTIKTGAKRVPFFLQDDTGKVLVDPEGAQVEVNRDYEFYSSTTKTPPQSIIQFMESSGIRYKSFLGLNRSLRFREYFIAPKDKLYILGTAGDNPYVEDGSVSQGYEDVMIQKGKKNSIYYISDKPEKDLIKNYKWRIVGGFVGGVLLILVGTSGILLGFNLF